MKVQLATLCLDEIQWLDLLYRQHRDWPGLEKWVFVEGADRIYAEANPGMVSADGLSVDGTTEFLADLAARDERVVHVKHGFSMHPDPAQQKCESRNRYLDIAEEVRPDFFFILDADEFYCRDHQSEINRVITHSIRRHSAWMFGLRSIWRPPSVAHWPLLRAEAVGCLFSVPICRAWRWEAGVRYRDNHNTPQTSAGSSLMSKVARVNGGGLPYCVHMGFAANLTNRIAKHRYYVARGEGRTDRRQPFVDSRSAFESWQDGAPLPHGARVMAYDGIIPEVFREECP